MYDRVGPAVILFCTMFFKINLPIFDLTRKPQEDILSNWLTAKLFVKGADSGA